MYNTHLTAIAPTRSNSIISGCVSPGIEPITANIYRDKTAKGSFTRKNPILEKVLENYNKNTDKVWKSIAQENGSVQHLKFLDEKTKAVFKTAYELDQKALVRQASQRQRFVCQAQSLNLFFPTEVDAKYYSDTHLLAWELGVKTCLLYTSPSPRDRG